MAESVVIRDLPSARECPDCGLFQRLPPIPDGEAALCVRCNALLQRAARDSIPFATVSLACAALLFVLALNLPLADFSVLGRFDTATVFSGPEMLRSAGLPALGLVVLGALVALPGAKLALELAVLFGLRIPHPPAWLPRLFVWVRHVSPWAMVDVFLLGSFVAYTRLKALAHVDVGLAPVAFGGVMLAMVASDATLDREAIWQELEARTSHLKRPSRRRFTDERRSASEPGLIGCDECGRVAHAEEGDPCPRCRHPLAVRKGGMDRVWALVIAAALLYIPANVLPVMSIVRMGKGGPSTIVNGVVELAKAQLWPLAMLVLLASVVIPMVKLVSLVTMLVMTHRRSAKALFARTRLFRFVRIIGRWSMIDIFMLSVLVGLVRFGAIASVVPNMGAVAFCGVVLVTMAATEMFDPRLMWDAAGLQERACEVKAKTS